MKRKKVKIIISILVIGGIVVVGGFSYNHMRKEKEYNTLLSKADESLKENNFKEAKSLYEDSIKLKGNSQVTEKISLINSIEDSLNKLDNIDALIQEKKFDESIDILNSLNNSSEYLTNKVKTKKEKERKEQQLKEEQAKNSQISNDASNKSSKSADLCNDKLDIRMNILDKVIEDMYISPEKALNIAAKDYFQKNPNVKVREPLFSIVKIDGSYFIDVEVNNKIIEYEMNPFNGEFDHIKEVKEKSFY